jgi:hypothetical protein
MNACLFSFSKACVCFGVRLDFEYSCFLIDDGLADTLDEALAVIDAVLFDEALAVVNALLFDEARIVVNALLSDEALTMNLAEGLAVIDVVLFDEALVVSSLLRDNGKKMEP